MDSIMTWRLGGSQSNLANVDCSARIIQLRSDEIALAEPATAHPGHFGRPGVIEPIGERTQWRNILFLAHSPPLLIKTRHVVQVVRVSCCDLLAGAQCASQPDQLGGCKLSSS